MFDSLNNRTDSVSRPSSHGIASKSIPRRTAGKSHLGHRHRQAAFAQVVTGTDQAGVDRAVHGGKGFFCDMRIELGNLTGPRASTGRRG